MLEDPNQWEAMNRLVTAILKQKEEESRAWGVDWEGQQLKKKRRLVRASGRGADVRYWKILFWGEEGEGWAEGRAKGRRTAPNEAVIGLRLCGSATVMRYRDSKSLEPNGTSQSWVEKNRGSSPGQGGTVR